MDYTQRYAWVDQTTVTVDRIRVAAGFRQPLLTNMPRRCDVFEMSSAELPAVFPLIGRFGTPDLPFLA